MTLASRADREVLDWLACRAAKAGKANRTQAFLAIAVTVENEGLR